MKDGKIEQHGAAAALYNTRSTGFAAQLFGFENILKSNDGQLVGDKGALPFSSDISGRHLAWRPAAVEVGAGEHQGVVRSIAFAGETREYVIEAACGTVFASVPAHDTAIPIGSEVIFGLPEAKAHLI